MSSQARTNVSAQKKLLGSVTRKIQVSEQKTDNNTSTSVLKKKKPTKAKTMGKLFSPYEREDCSEILRKEMLLASDSIEEDQELYRQSKKNPALLYFLWQKLSQIIKKKEICGSSGINEDVLGFTADLVNRGQEQGQDSYYGSLSGFTQPTFETYGSFIPNPGLNYRGPYIREYGFGSSLESSQISSQRPHKNFINNFCIKMLIINVVLVIIAFGVSSQGIKEPLIEQALSQKNWNEVYKNGEKNSSVEKSGNYDDDFDKSNHDLKEIIKNSTNPMFGINLKELFSFSYYSLGVQLFLWFLYFFFKLGQKHE